MKNVLFPAVLALFAFLPTAAASVTDPADPSGAQALAGRDDEGRARGTVVVWENYHSGKPTAHLRGTLNDRYGKRFADVVARLEDYGKVTGYARTAYGYYELRGWWKFDKYDDRGWFELEFDYGDSKEVELTGNWKGWRDYWSGDWELDYRHH